MSNYSPPGAMKKCCSRGPLILRLQSEGVVEAQDRLTARAKSINEVEFILPKGAEDPI
jgi:hypothetical protein